MTICGKGERVELDFGATTQVLSCDLTVAPQVLVVDDDELVLARLQGLVADAGFQVSTASNGADALDALQRHFTPILILDLNMPDLDGLAVCRAVRERTWPGYVYILLLTARDAEQDILAGLDAGADDYVSKRTSSAHLLARLRTAQRILTLEYSLKRALADKRQLAMTDALTGVPNRRFFMRRLGGEITHLRRTGGDLTLLSLDIDHFKRINDRFGHGAGDEVLQEFARRLGTCLSGASQWCARLGGEEFAVVLGGIALPQAIAVAERLRQVMATTPMRAGHERISVTVSIGMSRLDAQFPGETLESLLQQADLRLYESKRAGRNRVTAPMSKESDKGDMR